MIEITPDITIHDDEIEFEFIRASGPGGQNINKVASAVQLRFDVINSTSLPLDVRDRLINTAGNRISSEGILIIEAKRYRSQERNRQDAIDRFIKMVKASTEKPKSRKPTKPSEESKRRRLEDKRRHAERKRLRKSIPDEDG